MCCLTAIFSTTEQHILDSQKYVELFWKLILEFKCKIHYNVHCIWPSLSKSVWCLNTCEQKQYLLDRKSIISAITFIIKTFEHNYGLMFPLALCNNKPAGIKLKNSSLYTPNLYLLAPHQLVSSWHVLCTYLRQLLKLGWNKFHLFVLGICLCHIRNHVSLGSKHQSGLFALLPFD